MSTAQATRSSPAGFFRHALPLIFVLITGMAYAISPWVEGPVDTPAATDNGIVEPDFMPSDCAVDGLVFADCNLDF
jgi:hypothetical protein